jgi:TolA-binding protein
MKAIIIAGIVVLGMAVMFSLSATTEYVAPEALEIEEVIVEPSEEELRRLEWEKEAEEVRQRHIRVRELEHEAEVLREQRNLLNDKIKEIEKELGVY